VWNVLFGRRTVLGAVAVGSAVGRGVAADRPPPPWDAGSREDGWRASESDQPEWRSVLERAASWLS